MLIYKVLISDDHSIVRAGLRLHLQTHLNIHNIEDVNSCNKTMAALQQKDFTHLILDISLNDGSSLEIIPNIRKLYPKLRILVYSMQPQNIYGRPFKKYGIHHYIEKSTEEEKFFAALANFFNDYNAPIPINEDDNSNNPFTKLSPREMEILYYLLKGMGTKEIATNLNITMSTVSTIKQKIFEKTEMTNVKELTELADFHSLNY